MSPRLRLRRRPWFVAAIVFATAFLGVGAFGDALRSPALSAETAGGGSDVAGQPVANPSPNAPAAPGELKPTTSPDGYVPLSTFLPTPPPVPTAPPVDVLGGYQWPLPKGRLTLGFEHTEWGTRLVDGERFHDGIDLATFCGDKVVAAHSGVVLAAGRRFDDHVGWLGDLGPYYERLDDTGLWSSLPIVVVIDDGNGYRSIYAHFREVTVKKGQAVEAGQLIGYEGATGRASGCHLHYGLFSPFETERFGLHPDTVKRMKLPRWEIARVDPLLVLPPRP